MANASMTPLHSEAIEQENLKKIKKMRAWLIAWLLVGAALIVAALIWRNPATMDKSREMPARLIVIGVTLLFGGVWVFLHGLKLGPHLAYRRFLRDLKRGLSHDEMGVVVRFDEGETFREGLDFYQLVINVGDLKDERDERYLYWDANLPRPQLAPDDAVRVTVHGNDLVSLEKC